MRIVLATKNPGKLREIKNLAGAVNLDWVDFQLAPEEFNPEETGSTFAENALIKAFEAAKLTDTYALSDDSGIAVEALNGRPGIHSARYADNDLAACLKLIHELKDVPPNKRSATYHCVMVLVSPQGKLLCQTEGIWHGEIIDRMRGTEGFGYDPIFYLKDYGKTVAEISLIKKNLISHRAQAWQKIHDYLLANRSTLELS